MSDPGTRDAQLRTAAESLAGSTRRCPTDDWRSRNRDSALTYWARDTGVTRLIFRTVALAEAVSWAALLAGMYLKWVAQTTEVGVQIFGPIHGAIFLTYCGVALAAASVFRWPGKVTLLALACAVPPFATWFFERWALGSGLLADRPPAPLRR
jgi:integral membrane protein